MKIKKVKNIIIFGGGTSGWLSAAYLVKNLNFPCNITLIESTDIGPIGVGEGTQPATARFMYDCGFDPKTWMKPSNASFKLGVEFSGWTDDKYFVDNDFIENTIIAPDLYVPDYFVGKSKKEYFDWLPSYRMAKDNKSPKLAGLDTNYALTGYRQFGAVHFDAYNIVKTIKNLIINKITYINAKITEVKTDDDGIQLLIDENGNQYSADLYLDCSGFKSILLEKHLGIEFNSINDILPCDKAVVMPTKFNNPQEDCFPYTKATTMSAGWRFTIPVFTRTGNGYVYSSKFITPEKAEEELRNSIHEYKSEAKHLDMRCGIHQVVSHKNVCAIGLSAGFVEPLEATGITFSTTAIEMITLGLNNTQGLWTTSVQRDINKIYDDMFWEIVAFIWAHYHFSTKNDSPFWQSIHSQTQDTVPKKVLDTVEQFVPQYHRNFKIQPTSSFHVGHWFSVLNAGNVYNNSSKLLNGDIEKYAEYFIKNNSHRVDLVKETFPNHYDFLREWYDSK